MKLSVDVKKNYSLMVGVLILILGVGVFVVAYGGNTPAVMGHTASEVDMYLYENNPKLLGDFLRQDVCRRQNYGGNTWVNCPPDPESSSSDFIVYCNTVGAEDVNQPLDTGSCFEGAVLSGDGKCCQVLTPDDAHFDEKVTIWIGYDNDDPGNPDCWMYGSSDDSLDTCYTWSGIGRPSQYWCVNRALNVYNTIDVNGRGGWGIINWFDTDNTGNSDWCGPNDPTSDLISINLARSNPYIYKSL